MKVLFVGNSFSEDATRYLQFIADGELFVRNLYIGGCSLKTHVKNIHTDEEPYVYQENSEKIKNCSLTAGLLAEDWDIVSIQQVSNDSGVLDTYEPYITELVEYIQRCVPKAEIVFHRTWAYDLGSGHPYFHVYNNDPVYMEEMIEKTVAEITAKHSLRVIPSGVAVRMARECEMFSLDGGIPLTRDSYHLSLTHGRYLAGLVCFKALTGKSPIGVSYIPEGVSEESARLLQEIAERSFAEP